MMNKFKPYQMAKLITFHLQSFILNLSQTISVLSSLYSFHSSTQMFEQKLKPNRKKNLSSKIIVDEYDHLIKNSKMTPNYDTFLDPPLSPHFITKESKLVPSKQQSSQSEYSMHQQNEHGPEKQCFKCGDMFHQRIYNSHLNICEKRIVSSKKEEEKPCFNKKDEYNLFSMNQSIDPDHRLMMSARNKASKKQTQDLLDSRKGVELKKSTSKKSIGSLEKKTMNRPSSSTRNKLQIKGHQNLKQKILNKLQGTRKKNPESKDDHIKRVSSSQNKHTSSNSRPKSINKNVQRFGQQSKKFSTINSSSINKKKIPSQNANYEFNRSEIMSGFQSDPRKKQKVEFVSKANIKEEKKQTLKKKNINYNNSFVGGQQFQREKEKSVKNEGHYNFTENNSYMSGQRKYENVFEKQREQLREQLRKQGLFRRESSSSASKRKLNRQQERQRQEKPVRGMRQVNDEYYFFQNHPSSVPSHYIKRQEQSYSRYDQIDPEQVYQNNSSKIIRNKLGINKNLVKSKQNQAIVKKQEQRSKMQTEQQMLESRSREQKFIDSQLFERQIIHRRTNSSRQNNRNQRPNKPNLNTQYINGDINRTQTKPEQRNPRNQPTFPTRQQNQQTRTRPQNPMGNDRITSQRRQQATRPQNRPQQRITNQRMNSSHNQTHRQQVNEPQRIQQPVRASNNRTNLQNQQPRRPQTQQHQRRRPQQQQSRRQQQQSRRPQQQQSRRNQQQQRRQNSRQGTSRRQNRRQHGTNPPHQRIQQQTLNFISNTLNQQFQVMNGHFNLLNNIFSNFSNIVNVNITASTGNQNPTTFVFQNHSRRRRNRDSDGSHSSYSDFSSDFSQDQSVDGDTDYDEDEYYYEQQEEENPGMTEHQINSIPVLRYNREKHGNNQCTICLVELVEKEPFKKLFCDHVFHTECIDQWLKRKNACPVCRDQMGVRS